MKQINISQLAPNNTDYLRLERVLKKLKAALNLKGQGSFLATSQYDFQVQTHDQRVVQITPFGENSEIYGVEKIVDSPHKSNTNILKAQEQCWEVGVGNTLYRIKQ
jgi:hypothetical protein